MTSEKSILMREQKAVDLISGARKNRKPGRGGGLLCCHLFAGLLLFIFTLLSIPCPSYAGAGSCSYSIDPELSPTFAAAGGTDSVAVFASPGCAWTAASNDAWITVTSGATGAGDGIVSYSVAENTSGVQRTGTITIENLTFTVTQNPCTYSYAPSFKIFAPAGGTDSISVVAECSWTAVSNDDWITVTSGASGTGNGTVNYSVAANTGCVQRNGTIMVADLAFTVIQDVGACDFTITRIGSGVFQNAVINANGWVAWQEDDGKLFLYDGASTIQLADNSDSISKPAINANGWVTWVGDTANGMEIFLYNGVSTIHLTDNSYDNFGPAINDNGWVTWAGNTANGFEIFLYNGTDTIQLTHNDYDDGSPKINDNGWVTWQGNTANGWEIFLYNGVSTIQLTDNSYDNYAPAINANGWVTWMGNTANGWEIFLYNGADTIHLSEDIYSYNMNPVINDNGWVAWWGYGGDAWSVFLYNGTSTIRLTDDACGDYSPAINANGWVTWYRGCGRGIFLYDGTSKIELTLGNDSDPAINSKGWIAFTGFDADIFLAKPYAIDPGSASYPGAGGAGSVAVNIHDNVSAWTAASNDSWITVTAGATGAGDGTVNYSVAENNSGIQRTGTITISTLTFTVTQDFSLSAPTAGSNSPVCVGTTLNLTASTVPGATYSWTGPNGFTSSQQNPSISGATTAATGTYSVTATVGTCTSSAGTTSVTVNAIPSAPTAGSNSPVCAGKTLNLTASTVTGATYSWTGPNGFTSSSQNPSISGVAAAAAGTYRVTATIGSCISSAGTTDVTVNAIPSTPTGQLASPSTINSGSSSNLTASVGLGETLYWYTGSCGGTLVGTGSKTVSPTTTTTYYASAKNAGGCESSCASITVTVNAGTPLPPNAVLYIESNTTDGDTTFTDEAPAHHVITPYGGVHNGDSASYTGRTQICFDGNDDYLSAAMGTDADFGMGDFSIGLWVNFDRLVDYNTLFSSYSDGAPKGYMMCLYKGEIMWYSPGTDWMHTNFTPTLGAWAHVAVVRSGNMLTLYINGVAKTSKYCAGLSFNSLNGNFKLGWMYPMVDSRYLKGHMNKILVVKGSALWTGNFTPTNYPDPDMDHDGLSNVDEINIYHTDPLKADTDGDGLSDGAEVNIYHTNPLKTDTDGDGVNDGTEVAAGSDPLNISSVPTYPSQLYINSNTTDGSKVFVDNSPAHHTVTPYGDVHHGDSAAYGGSTAVCFDGTGDYLNAAMGSDADFGTGDFTIDLWANFSRFDDFNALFSTYNPWFVNGYLMCISGGTIQWLSPGTGWINTGVAPTAGAWVHVAAVRLGNTFTLYVNGVAKASKSCSGVSFNSINGNFIIGRLYLSTDAYYFKGHMNQIRVTKGHALWTGNFPPPNSPLLTFTILETSDIHDHASGYGPFRDYTPNVTGNDSVLGGYARMATVIGGIKATQTAAGVPTLLLDAGDFYMGATYDMTASNPIALKFFQAMGYNAVTLGNHEFDWGPSGLAAILTNGKTNGFTIPVISSNMVTNGNTAMNAMFAGGNLITKRAITLFNGIKIGLLGLMGPGAEQDAPARSPITFNHAYSFIQGKVDDLVNNDKVSLVVALSHGGINAAGGNGDDFDLASNVTGIDIIASGHYHTAATSAAYVPNLSDPSHNTLIISPGSYGEYVGRLDIDYNPTSDQIVAYRYNRITVDDTVLGNAAIQSMVNTYNTSLNTTLSAMLGLQLNTQISSTTFPLEKADFTVTGQGSLCADSLRNVSNAVAAFNFGTPVQIGIIGSGTIRDGIYPGNTGTITFSDAYNSLPLGASPYDPSTPGYPLMSIYVRGWDLWTICEVGMTYSHLFGADYFLNFSGLEIDYNTAVNHVTAINIYNPADTFCTGAATPIALGDLYHVAVGLYELQMMNVINTLLGTTIAPRDAAGNPILPANYGSCRIDASPAAGVQELKEWLALVQYLKGFTVPPGPPYTGPVPAPIYGTGGLATGALRVHYLP